MIFPEHLKISWVLAFLYLKGEQMGSGYPTDTSCVSESGVFSSGKKAAQASR